MRAIDADELIVAIEQMMKYQIDADDICEMIQNFPTIKPERKKGKWVKVHGYATPGGDPVWCCSECGKGLHVYGIEHSSYGRDVADGQWVACPNCEAVMIEREQNNE